jgi:hypothetical protein
MVCCALVVHVLLSQNPSTPVYLRRGNDAVEIRQQDVPNLKVSQWQIWLFNVGESQLNYKNSRGMIISGTQADALKRLAADQQLELRFNAFCGRGRVPNAKGLTAFNFVGPVAVVDKTSTGKTQTGKAIEQMFDNILFHQSKWMEAYDFLQDARTIGTAVKTILSTDSATIGQNPYAGIGSALREYATNIVNATQTTRQLAYTLNGNIDSKLQNISSLVENISSSRARLSVALNQATYQKPDTAENELQRLKKELEDYSSFEANFNQRFGLGETALETNAGDPGYVEYADINERIGSVIGLDKRGGSVVGESDDMFAWSVVKNQTGDSAEANLAATLHYRVGGRKAQIIGVFTTDKAPEAEVRLNLEFRRELRDYMKKLTRFVQLKKIQATQTEEREGAAQEVSTLKELQANLNTNKTIKFETLTPPPVQRKNSQPSVKQTGAKSNQSKATSARPQTSQKSTKTIFRELQSILKGTFTASKDLKYPIFDSEDEFKDLPEADRLFMKQFIKGGQFWKDAPNPGVVVAAPGTNPPRADLIPVEVAVWRWTIDRDGEAITFKREWRNFLGSRLVPNRIGEMNYATGLVISESLCKASDLDPSDVTIGEAAAMGNDWRLLPEAEDDLITGWRLVTKELRDADSYSKITSTKRLRPGQQRYRVRIGTLEDRKVIQTVYTFTPGYWVPEPEVNSAELKAEAKPPVSSVNNELFIGFHTKEEATLFAKSLREFIIASKGS